MNSYFFILSLCFFLCHNAESCFSLLKVLNQCLQFNKVSSHKNVFFRSVPTFCKSIIGFFYNKRLLSKTVIPNTSNTNSSFSEVSWTSTLKNTYESLILDMLTTEFEIFSLTDECIQKWSVPATKDRHYSKHNNKEDCENDNGRWLELHSFLEKASASTEAACDALSTSTGVPHKWAIPYDGWKNNYQEECLVALSEPECRAADFSRVNHHGNGIKLVMTTYDWALPYFPSREKQKCVFRFR